MDSPCADVFIERESTWLFHSFTAACWFNFVTLQPCHQNRINTFLVTCPCTNSSRKQKGSSFFMCFSFPLIKVQINQDYRVLSNVIDQILGTSFTTEGMEAFILLIIRCLDPSSERRPSMNYVVMELERILEKEMNLTTLMGEGTPTVTLGSQLFRATR